MSHSFTFNNTASTTYGIHVNNKSVFGAPSRDVSEAIIPGRSGNLLLDNNRYENFPVKYDCYMVPLTGYTTMLALSKAIKGWLLATNYSYYTLTDTYNPGYFRKAAFSSQLDIVEVFLSVGKAQINFNCKPFLYLTTGQSVTTLTTPGTVTNPELFPSYPYIKVTGSGNVTLSIGSASFVLTAISPSIEIDSETMNVYRGGTSLNSKMTSNGFPVFAPGNNAISWTGTVTKLEIIPRWCTL